MLLVIFLRKKDHLVQTKTAFGPNGEPGVNVRSPVISEGKSG